MIFSAPDGLVKVQSSLNAKEMEEARKRVIGLPIKVDDTEEHKEVLKIVNSNEVGKPDRRILQKWKQHT